MWADQRPSDEVHGPLHPPASYGRGRPAAALQVLGSMAVKQLPAAGTLSEANSLELLRAIAREYLWWHLVGAGGLRPSPTKA